MRQLTAASARCGSHDRVAIVAAALPESALPVGTAFAVPGTISATAAQPMTIAANLRFTKQAPFERITRSAIDRRLHPDRYVDLVLEISLRPSWTRADASQA